jgi:hypothetical protein
VEGGFVPIRYALLKTVNLLARAERQPRCG